MDHSAEQPTFDDYAAGLQDRDEGAQATLDAAHPAGLIEARERFQELVRSGREFSGDDVPRPIGCSANIIGAMFLQAARRGEIVQTGWTTSQRREARGRAQKRWRRAS